MQLARVPRWTTLPLVAVTACAHSSGPPPAPAKVVLEARPGEAVLFVNDRPRYFIRGGCNEDERRERLPELDHLMAAVHRMRAPKIDVRTTRDLPEPRRQEILDSLWRAGRLGRAEVTPAAGPPTCVRSQLLPSKEAAVIVKGSLEKSEIADEIQDNLQGFRACYEAVLARDYGARGKVRLHFIIGPTGAVGAVEVLEQTVHPDIGPCMVVHMSKLRFPAPRGGDLVSVTYPFTFGSSGR